jgi:hypothetical protein
MIKLIKKNQYPFIIRQLSNEEGGGYLIEFPDLPGCISDGKTIDESISMLLTLGLKLRKKWIDVYPRRVQAANGFSEFRNQCIYV